MPKVIQSSSSQKLQSIFGLQKISDFYASKNSLLKNSCAKFVADTNFLPQIGVELEFYLLDQNSQRLENHAIIADYILSLQNLLTPNFAYQVEKEQGVSQIEIKIAPHFDLILLAQKIEKIKELTKNLAQEKNFIANFASQPFVDDCGSALQFNFSLHDEKQNNLLDANQNLLQNIIAGMLDSVEWAMVFYAPKKEDYLRFDLEINRKLHKQGKFTAPTNISFGDNNRTVAVRVAKNQNSQKNRVEFRVAAADADPFLSMLVLLGAIGDAIKQNAIPQDSQKIFGNAFDEQYLLKKICDLV